MFVPRSEEMNVFLFVQRTNKRGFDDDFVDAGDVFDALPASLDQ